MTRPGFVVTVVTLLATMGGWVAVNPAGQFGISRHGLTTFNRIPIPLLDLQVRDDGAVRCRWKSHDITADRLKRLTATKPAVLIIGVGWEGSARVPWIRSALDAVEQGDEADEAFGGTVPRTKCRLMPAPAGNRGHRFAAYRRCSVDAASRVLSSASQARGKLGQSGGRHVFSALVEELQLATWAYVFITTSEPKKVVRSVRRLGGVVHADALFGSPDVIAIVSGRDIAEMDAVIDRIAKVPFIAGTDSKVARWLDGVELAVRPSVDRARARQRR